MYFYRTNDHNILYGKVLKKTDLFLGGFNDKFVEE